MGSYSSDEDSSRSRKSKKHRRHNSRSRSRSRSSSYDRKHKKHSSRRRISRDRSYDKRRGRSRDRSKSYDRSRGRSRDRSPRDKSRDRSRSRGRSSGTKGNNINQQLDLKEKIRLLTTSDQLTVKQAKEEVIAYKPSADDIRKIEEDVFVQESFYKSLSGATTQPSAGKGKKKKKKNKQNQQVNTLNKAGGNVPSMDFSDFQQKEALLLKQDTSHEPLYGALFSETPEVRKERWVEKLQSMRKRIAQ